MTNKPTTTRVHLDLGGDPQRERLYREALARIDSVEIDAQIDAGTEALVTTDPAKSGSAPCLLVRPESVDAERLGALAASGRKLMPAHEWRFLPGVAGLQHASASGVLGDPGLLRIHHWITGDAAPRSAAVAQVDLATWLFGGRAEMSHAIARQGYLQLHFGYAGGGMAVIDVATGRPGADDYYSAHLIGSSGAAYADDHRNAHLQFDAGGTRALLHPQNTLLAAQKLLAEFVGGIRERRHWSVTLDDTLAAQQQLEDACDA